MKKSFAKLRAQYFVEQDRNEATCERLEALWTQYRNFIREHEAKDQPGPSITEQSLELADGYGLAVAIEDSLEYPDSELTQARFIQLCYEINEKLNALNAEALGDMSLCMVYGKLVKLEYELEEALFTLDTDQIPKQLEQLYDAITQRIQAQKSLARLGNNFPTAQQLRNQAINYFKAVRGYQSPYAHQKREAALLLLWTAYDLDDNASLAEIHQAEALIAGARHHSPATHLSLVKKQVGT